MSAPTSVTPAPQRRGGSVWVAAGILLSRLAGLVREMAVTRAFGFGAHGDVFRAALRVPNVLQNLLGEGTLSASFIPIYSRLLAEGRREDAGRFAGAICGLLVALAGFLVLVGVVFAAPLVTLLTPGYLGDAAEVATGAATVDRFALTVVAVRYIFPMTGLLVLSAWALGVLNSHRRFFLSYVAPVIWSAAIIGALAFAGGFDRRATALVGVAGDAALYRLLIAACLGALVGGGLQLLVQLPFVARELSGFRLSLSPGVEGVRAALRAFGPAVASRGVAQIGAYLELTLASYLAVGAVSAISNAQALYLLPISLFGLSVAAAELPEMAAAGRQRPDVLVARAQAALRRMAFFTVPTALAFVAFGLLLVVGLFRSGRFDLAAAWLSALTLAAYAVGVVPTTTSRLLQNVCYALGEVKTAARIAMLRTAVGAAAGFGLMRILDRVSLVSLVGADGQAARPFYLGAVGLAGGSALAAAVELWRLDRAIVRSLPGFALPWSHVLRVSACAAGAALVAAPVWWFGGRPRLLLAVGVLGVYGVVYLGLTAWAGVSELAPVLRRLRGTPR